MLRALRNEDAWDFLTPDHALFRSEVLTLGLRDIEALCTESGSSTTARAPLWAVLKTHGEGEVYLIHAFSGRRRPGDFQHFVDQARMKNKDMLIHTISVDIMVDPIWGDVSRPEARAF